MEVEWEEMVQFAAVVNSKSLESKAHGGAGSIRIIPPLSVTGQCELSHTTAVPQPQKQCDFVEGVGSFTLVCTHASGVSSELFLLG